MTRSTWCLYLQLFKVTLFLFYKPSAALLSSIRRKYITESLKRPELIKSWNFFPHSPTHSHTTLSSWSFHTYSINDWISNRGAFIYMTHWTIFDLHYCTFQYFRVLCLFFFLKKLVICKNFSSLSMSISSSSSSSLLPSSGDMNHWIKYAASWIWQHVNWKSGLWDD